MWFELRILFVIFNKLDIYIYKNIRVDIYILRLEI